MTCAICGRDIVPRVDAKHGGICWSKDAMMCYRIGYEREKARATDAVAQERARCLAVIEQADGLTHAAQWITSGEAPTDVRIAVGEFGAAGGGVQAVDVRAVHDEALGDGWRTCKRCGGPKKDWQVYCGAACSQLAEWGE